MDDQQPDPLADWLKSNGLRLAYAISLRSTNGSVVALADALRPDYLSSNWTLVIDHKAVPQEQKPE